MNFGTIVVVGGGCYGGYYLRQLSRAYHAGAAQWNKLLIVDRDPGCAVAAAGPVDASLPAVELVIAEWSAFFDSYLSRWESDGSDAVDAIVPSPLMPHLLYEWLRDRAAARWPDRAVSTKPLSAPAGTPWERAAPDGTHYASFAEWICPVNCIEPARCPHTGGPRSWTMPAALNSYVEQRRQAGEDIRGPVVFHCTHRVYGVGMIDTGDVIAADRKIAKEAIDAPATFLVGTVSHCHGAMNVLSIA